MQGYEIPGSSVCMQTPYPRLWSKRHKAHNRDTKVCANAASLYISNLGCKAGRTDRRVIKSVGFIAWLLHHVSFPKYTTLDMEGEEKKNKTQVLIVKLCENPIVHADVLIWTRSESAEPTDLLRHSLIHTFRMADESFTNALISLRGH